MRETLQPLACIHLCMHGHHTGTRCPCTHRQRRKGHLAFKVLLKILAGLDLEYTTIPRLVFFFHFSVCVGGTRKGQKVLNALEPKLIDRCEPRDMVSGILGPLEEQQ